MNFKKWREAEHPAKINLKNIKSFIQGTFRGILSRSGNEWLKRKFLPKHIKDQVYIRAVLAEKCVRNGACIDCGCDSDKIWSDLACSKYYKNEKDYCYGEFVDAEKWLKMNFLGSDIIDKGKNILKSVNKLKNG